MCGIDKKFLLNWIKLTNIYKKAFKKRIHITLFFSQKTFTKKNASQEIRGYKTIG